MVRQFEREDLLDVSRLAHKFMTSDTNMSRFSGSLDVVRGVFNDILVNSDNSVCFVSVIDGVIVGMIVGVYVRTWFNPEIIVLQELCWYMEKQYRSTSPDGIRLMKKFEQHAVQSGVKHVVISTLAGGDESVDKIVMRMGFIGSDSVFYKEV